MHTSSHFLLRLTFFAQNNRFGLFSSEKLILLAEIYKAQTAKLQVKKTDVAEPAKPKEGNVIKLKPEDEPAEGTDGANKPAPRRGCC